ncbi:MAG: extracellular solute-binding protein [Erysipelotrichaceae bacterium]|nr:extracellular solute-binding protein [Erysipelotrichaceae bacterium]
MKKFLALCLALMMTLCLFGCSGGSSSDGGSSDVATYDVTIWVSETEGVKELTQQQVDRFLAENTDVSLNVTIEGISESDSATQMITDVESGADIYCFAQDQLARLVQAGALAVLGEGASATVTDLNDAGSVKAATVDGKIYCYPLTSDNGYFMYYDKSVISDDIVDSLEDLVKACEDANKFFSMEYKTSAWYNAAFFFATGCVSDWTADADGKFTSVNDTFDSPEGLIAMKGMEILAKSSAANSSSDGSEFSKGSAVVVTGTWASSTVKDILGDNMGVADLPSFTVDGTSYHLGSFSGNKLMGVKPQTDAVKASVCQRLALYLTNEECQLERFEQYGWGPSNKAAQASDAVKSDAVLSALAEQNNYATPQGQIHGSWWDIAKILGTVAETSTSDADLQAGLDAYKGSIDALFSLNGYIFVGSWNGWSNSDTSFSMEENGENYSITVTVEAGAMGRIVTAGDWDTDKGAAEVVEGADLIDVSQAGTDNNIVFVDAGTYTVTFNTTSKEVRITK